MKYSAIEQLYEGEGGRRSVKLSQETLEQVDKVIAYNEQMTQLLSESPEELEVFEIFRDALQEQLRLYSRDHFEAGFRFGILMGMEISEKD